jgi:hypothetical protein
MIDTSLSSIRVALIMILSMIWFGLLFDSIVSNEDE